MATFFRVHPDKSNRDLFDPESRLYDSNLNEAKPEDVHSNDVLITATPEEWDVIQAAHS